MRHLLIITLLLALFTLPVLAQPDAVPGHEQAPVTGKPQQPAPEGPDLLKGQWREGDLAVLKAMTAADIVKMQIFALEREPGIVVHINLPTKHYLSPPFGTEGKAEVTALLALIKQAPKYEIPAGVPLVPMPPDRVLVVQPVKGEPFQFSYSAALHEPCAGVYSRELKEALLALSAATSRFSVIQLDINKTIKTINGEVIPPQAGGMASQTLAIALHLTQEKGLTLSVKLRDETGNILLDDEQPVHYGEATLFTPRVPGEYIVLLQQP